MRICLYEDRRVAGLHPLTLTRPAADLLCGLTTLGRKQARHFGSEVVGHLCRPALADWLRARDPFAPVNEPAWLRAAPAVLVNGRWLPPRAPAVARDWFAEGPFVGTVEGEVAFAVLDTRRLQVVSPGTVDDCLDDWSQTLPRREVGGALVRGSFDLVDANGAELARDFAAACDPAEAGFHPAGLALVGPAERLFVHASARIDPHVVADTTAGPVFVGEGAAVTAFTRLEGPCAVGAHAQLLSAKVRGGTTIGPHCRVGGEVECSVLLGYVNKYHDGFLGHSYVGEWVNLAAGTITGDLRCDYRPVRVRVNGVEVSTGRTKAGSVFGDHAKTGLGVLLNCGTSVGAFAQVLSTGTFAPREVASFTRVGPGGTKGLGVAEALATADVVMRRRGRELTPQLEAVYRALAGATAAESGDEASPAAVTIPLRRTA
jgi:UDP-N-acetylglucosamine diphosphorylase/glucosamine-1-phosphate N-acetyltransferase